MSLLHFLPGVVKELAKHVPDLALEVTDWRGVSRDIPVISHRWLTGAGIQELRRAHEHKIGAFVEFSSGPGPTSADLPTKEKGDAILKLYFAQLYVPEGLFFDLRDQHFDWKEGKLLFAPNGLWYRLSDAFRTGILTVYQGFYRGDEKLFEEGLVATGLLDRSWSQEDQSEIKNLFRSHFGESLDRDMVFGLAGFQESFLKIFQFLVRKKIKLSSEFMVFGICLVTLYLALEKGAFAHAVRSIFLEVDQFMQGRKEEIPSPLSP